ncbi:YqjD family protein [Aquicoccus sp. G2-2]|uniref:DUF883 family protein n=1 Tax=Aquicoccus sp. G2-2 TaxID=3092120 RepID=UPI002ADF4D25|nr:hypothetical protein [Aquicoccus sp. G2-2]MEA1115237.1 hypothetical protein [Aquicoccus sp. G2-2]
MAEAKSTLKPNDAEAQALSEQMADLRADIAGITKTLAEMGAARGEAAKESAQNTVSALRDQGEKALKDAQARAEAISHQAADTVREQPAVAVGLAVGLGFLLGFVSGRK